MIGNMRPILCANIPAMAKIIGCNIVGRPVPGLDLGQNFDRRGDLRPRGQEAEGLLSPAPNSSLPGLSRQSMRRDVDARVEPTAVRLSFTGHEAWH
jgi:hypothetical protein